MSWLPKQHVIVPIDFSDDSIAAVNTAREMVSDASQLHVIYVLPVLEPTEPGVIWNTIDDVSRSKHAENAVRQRLTDPKFEGLNVHIAFGDPGFEITELAKKIQSELIVLPSHGRTGLSRMLLGSVAEKVVRLAHCPVLVLRK